jgi:hypothetical protein
MPAARGVVAGPHALVPHQSLVPFRELILVFHVFHGRRQAIAPMSSGTAPTSHNAFYKPADRLSNDSEKQTITLSQFEYVNVKWYTR